MADETITTKQASADTATAAPTASASDVSAKIKSRKRKKSKVKITKGKIFINSTYNNTIITVTDLTGNVVVWGSAGKAGFKGSKKSTPYAGALQISFDKYVYFCQSSLFHPS